MVDQILARTTLTGGRTGTSCEPGVTAIETSSIKVRFRIVITAFGSLTIRLEQHPFNIHDAIGGV